MKNDQGSMADRCSNETLFRYLVLSKVLACEQQGQTRSAACAAIAGEKQTDPDGTRRSVSVRTLYRWLNRFEKEGFSGLAPRVRQTETVSKVISETLLDFCKQQKADDPKTAI